MPPVLLTTKLYAPPPGPHLVSRPRLLERLGQNAGARLTLVSASAGSGKTTLVGEWIAADGRPSAWLSLDEADNDITRFLTYLIGALRQIDPALGDSLLAGLRSPQPPAAESILTSLLNELAASPKTRILVIDDYHLIDAPAVHDATAFLIERAPQTLHLVIATREDPPLPLARWRARGQLTELRAADLRFTQGEAHAYLNQAMALRLSNTSVAALEARTEGWITGLQLAAISLRGHADAEGFINAFSGQHRFVLDYLVEEVLGQQPAAVQSFLLRTAILDRLCAPLCEAVLGDPALSGQAMLSAIEKANLFVVPLDGERRWYRYHHLFGELLRQRLQHQAPGEAQRLHVRASEWYERNGLELEGFHHAVLAQDIDRAARLVEGNGMPLHFRGAVLPVLNWLDSLPMAALDARPALRVIYASALLFRSKISGIEPQLALAERAVAAVEPSAYVNNLIGHIAAIRATVAVSQHQADVIAEQSQRALAHLDPHNAPIRISSAWALAVAHNLKGDRVAARRGFADAVAQSEAVGHFMMNIMATLGLGQVDEAGQDLDSAEQDYRRMLRLTGEPPMAVAGEAYLGLARIAYARNDLDSAAKHAQRAAQLAPHIESTDRSVAVDVFLARLKLTQGDAAGAAGLLAQTNDVARQRGFVQRLPDIAAIQVITLLHQGDLTAAAALTQSYDLPLSRARVLLAQGDGHGALSTLAPVRAQAEANGWHDIRLNALLLQSLAHQAADDAAAAVRALGDALALAEIGGQIRCFADEGAPMAALLAQAIARGIRPEFASKILAAFPSPVAAASQPLIEPLTPRELEVLKLIAQGLSNQEIGERLFLALSTVKGYNQRIFDKLQTQRRTEAVVRARELGLI